MTEQELVRVETLFTENAMSCLVERGLKGTADGILADARILIAEIRKLRAVLTREDVQWGSCDGCGNHNHCPSCNARARIWNDGDKPDPGQHDTGCPIGEAIGNAKAPPGPSGAE